jgi:AcrR family transcriptional regulator
LRVAQVLKEEVEQRIREAALRVFAARGFGQAGVADIAREARVSSGNVYRYFESKEVLFDAVVPRSLATRLLRLLGRRVRALSGVRDVGRLPGSAFFSAAEQLVTFSMAHRLETVILLSRTEGTPLQGFDEKLVRFLEKLALAHFQKLDPSYLSDPGSRIVLRIAYENMVRAMAMILERSADEAEIRAAVAAYSRYHLAGLKHLFET